MSADFVSTRQIGKASVSLISDGSGRSTIIKQLTVPEAEWRKAVPEADADGEITVGYNLCLVQIGTAHVLIDLGFDEPSATSRWKAPRHQRSPGLDAGLLALGVVSDQIDYVVITHAHGDHFAGATVARGGRRLARIPRAKHLLGRGDWEMAKGGDSEMAEMHLGTIEKLGLLELVEGDREVVPGVRMIHAPGESPGHSIVRVESEGQRFYFLGDLFHHPCELEHLSWVPRGRDSAVMERSRRAFLEQAEDATAVFTHRPWPAWGHVVRSGSGHQWVDEGAS